MQPFQTRQAGPILPTIAAERAAFTDFDELTSVRGITPAATAPYLRRTPAAEPIRPWTITRAGLVAGAILTVLDAAGQLGELREPLLVWCRSGLLLVCAAVLGLISASKLRRGSPFALQWSFLAGGCALLSLLAGVQLARSDWLAGGEPAVWMGWAALAAALGIAYRPLVRQLPPGVKNMALLAGVVYLLGSMGARIVGSGQVALDQQLPAHSAAATLGPLAEILAALILLHALLAYAAGRQIAFRFERDDTPHLVLGPGRRSPRS